MKLNINNSENDIHEPSDVQMAERTQGVVGEDKRVKRFARTCSVATARQASGGRAHTRRPRSPRRQLVQLTIWAQADVAAEIGRLAEQNHLSLSSEGAQLLEHAVRARLHEQHAVLLQPLVEQAIRDYLGRLSARLAALLVRVVISPDETRSLVTNVLARHPSLIEDELYQILDQTKLKAKRSLVRSSPEFQELRDELARYLAQKQHEEVEGR